MRAKRSNRDAAIEHGPFGSHEIETLQPRPLRLAPRFRRGLDDRVLRRQRKDGRMCPEPLAADAMLGKALVKFIFQREATLDEGDQAKIGVVDDLTTRETSPGVSERATDLDRAILARLDEIDGHAAALLASFASTAFHSVTDGSPLPAFHRCQVAR